MQWWANLNSDLKTYRWFNFKIYHLIWKGFKLQQIFCLFTNAKSRMSIMNTEETGEIEDNSSNTNRRLCVLMKLCHGEYSLWSSVLNLLCSDVLIMRRNGLSNVECVQLRSSQNCEPQCYLHCVSKKRPTFTTCYNFYIQFDCDNFWHKCCRESRQSKRTLFSHHS